jgi:hypothetical protein
VLVTLKDSDGRAVTKVVNVRQLGYDMFFSPSGTLEYEALGGSSLSFPVTSGVPWKLEEKPDQTYLELSDAGEQPAATGEPYYFSLEANPLYVPRTATIKVSSSNEDFAERTFDIRQKSVDPFIIITDPTDGGDPPVHEHAFTSSATKTVTFTTNAKWKFTVDDATYANVITDASETKDATHDLGATPTGPEDGSVIFTPATGAGTLPAGTISTKVKFFTADHAGASENMKEVTFSRVIPENWTFLGYSLDGGAYTTPPATLSRPNNPATNVWLHAQTNVNWYGRRNSDSPVNTPTVTGYMANSTRTVTVTALDVNTKTSWADNGTGNVDTQIWYGYKLNGGQPAPNATDYFTVQQAPYTLSTNKPANMGELDVSVTVNVTTTAPSYSLVLMVNGTTTEVGRTGWQSSELSPTIDVKPNTGSTRQINITNGVTGKVLTYFDQPYSRDYRFIGPYSNVGWDGSVPLGVTCPTGYHLHFYGVYEGARIQDRNGNTFPVGNYYVIGSEYIAEYWLNRDVIISDGGLLSWGKSSWIVQKTSGSQYAELPQYFQCLKD